MLEVVRERTKNPFPIDTSRTISRRYFKKKNKCSRSVTFSRTVSANDAHLIFSFSQRRFNADVISRFLIPFAKRRPRYITVVYDVHTGRIESPQRFDALLLDSPENVACIPRDNTTEMYDRPVLWKFAGWAGVWKVRTAKGRRRRDARRYPMARYKCDLQFVNIYLRLYARALFHPRRNHLRHV